MALHRDLTGDELHEPKGIDTAPAGTVYEADGVGSGEWVDRHEGNLTRNKYWLKGRIPDVSTPNSHDFFFIPVKSKIISLSAVLEGTITTANATLTIYVNGVAFTDTLLIPFAGSTAGSAFNVNALTANVLNPGVVLEVRSDGASDGAIAAHIQLGLQAID